MLKRDWLLGPVLAIAWTAAFVNATNAAVEPAWQSVGTLGDVELRSYGPLVQARTPMPGGEQSSGVFRTLADYIFGGNSLGQEIEMTAPVLRSMASEDNYMAFIMPEALKLDRLPVPNDDRVTLHAVPAKTVAVISFSGWARDKAVQENRQVLLDTLASNGIEPRGLIVLAQYNPPWTLPWLRRNEVMVEIPAQR